MLVERESLHQDERRGPFPDGPRHHSGQGDPGLRLTVTFVRTRVTRQHLPGTGAGFEVAGKAEQQGLNNILDEREKICQSDRHWQGVQQSERSFGKWSLTGSRYGQGAREHAG